MEGGGGHRQIVSATEDDARHGRRGQDAPETPSPSSFSASSASLFRPRKTSRGCSIQEGCRRSSVEDLWSLSSPEEREAALDRSILALSPGTILVVSRTAT